VSRDATTALGDAAMPDDAAGSPGDAAAAPPDAGTPPPRHGPGSLDLIDQAEAQGELDTETALTYRVFATFGDARLPARYRGDDTGRFGIGILHAVSERFDSLSADTQRTLAPFLVPPPYRTSSAGSASSPHAPERPTCSVLDGRWSFAVGTTGPRHVQVWYLLSSDKIRAEDLAREIETKIWPKLTAPTPLGEGLLAPLSDSAEPCNGGTGALDLYLVEMALLSEREPLGEVGSHLCRESPVALFLRRDLPPHDLALAAAHEIMHAIQFAYKSSACVSSYGWLLDATATWAMDYVYGKGDNALVHPWARELIRSPERSIDDRKLTGATGATGTADGRDYGAYLFFQFLVRTQGPGSVRKVWEATISNPTSLAAVNAAIPGGFFEQWLEFSKRLWNREPVDARASSFKHWDDLTDAPLVPDLSGDLNGKPEHSAVFSDHEINNLATQYYRFLFKDPNTRSVLFYNGYFNPDPEKRRVKVLAMWKDATQTWHEEEWTKYEFVGLCRDLAEQRASELILVVSNSAFLPAGGGKLVATNPPYLKRSNLGCWKYEGHVTTVTPVGRFPGVRVESEHISFELEAGETGLEVTNPAYPDVLRAFLPLRFTQTGQRYSFSVDYQTQDHCHLTAGPVSFAIDRSVPTVSGYLMTNPFPELKSDVPFLRRWLGQPARSYSVVLHDARTVPTLARCPGATKTTVTPVGEILLTDNHLVLGTAPPVVNARGLLVGEFTAGPTTATWTLEPQAQP
jgi:hypothetical protein